MHNDITISTMDRYPKVTIISGSRQTGRTTMAKEMCKTDGKIMPMHKVVERMSGVPFIKSIRDVYGCYSRRQRYMDVLILDSEVPRPRMTKKLLVELHALSFKRIIIVTLMDSELTDILSMDL